MNFSILIFYLSFCQSNGWFSSDKLKSSKVFTFKKKALSFRRRFFGGGGYFIIYGDVIPALCSKNHRFLPALAVKAGILFLSLIKINSIVR